jgi:CHAD domain-containing protein
MNRVIDAVERVRTSPDADAVHELRVAIRRCRSIATIMQDVDPHRGWRSMKRLPRRLFRALGELRDVHILEEWIAILVLDPPRGKLLEALHARAAERHGAVQDAIEQFEGRAWKRVARTLQRRVSLVAPDGAAAQILALDRCRELRRLHVRALRISTPEHWHRLRVGLKRFRYVVESFLPARHAAWQDDLRQLQDILGKLHDLHALDAFVALDVTGEGAEAVGALRTVIAGECQSCIDQYHRRTRGRANVLARWRSGLPRGTRIEAANSARLRATALAADPNVRRTLRTAQLAMELFDVLRAAGVGSRLCVERTRMLLRSAARLHGVRSDDKRVSRQKAAWQIVRAMPAPVGWTRGEWDVVAWTVRYHRGAEPKPTTRAFARLPADRQDVVRGLAGVLRLARALRRGGAREILPGTAYAGGDVRLRAIGLADSRKTAARIGSAKHLLQTQLKRQVIIECA